MHQVQLVAVCSIAPIMFEKKIQIQISSWGFLGQYLQIQVHWWCQTIVGREKNDVSGFRRTF